MKLTRKSMKTRITDEMKKIIDYMFFIAYQSNRSIKGTSQYKAMYGLISIWLLISLTLHMLGLVNDLFFTTTFIIVFILVHIFYNTEKGEIIVDNIKENYTQKERLKYRILSLFFSCGAILFFLITLVSIILQKINDKDIIE
jgi:hypothetical protein